MKPCDEQLCPWHPRVLFFGRIPLFICCVLAVGAPRALESLLEESPSRLLRWLAFAGVYMSGLLLIVIRETRLRARLRTTNGELCPLCGYDLSAQPEETGTCPECGREFRKKALRELWQTTFLLTWPPWE